jgi:hypothetical protein
LKLSARNGLALEKYDAAGSDFTLHEALIAYARGAPDIFGYEIEERTTVRDRRN